MYNKQSHNNTRLGLYSCPDFTFPFESIRLSVHFGFTSQELLLSLRGTGKRIHLNLVAIAFSYFGLDPIHNSFSRIYIQFSQLNVLWSFPGDRPWSEGKASQWAVWGEWALHGCLQSDRSFDRTVHVCHFNTGFTPSSSLKWIICICKVTLWPADIVVSIHVGGSLVYQWSWFMQPLFWFVILCV